MSIRSRMIAKARSVDVHADLTLFNNAKHIREYGANPNAAFSAPLCSLCIDTATSDVYINTDGASEWGRIVD